MSTSIVFETSQAAQRAGWPRVPVRVRIAPDVMDAWAQAHEEAQAEHVAFVAAGGVPMELDPRGLAELTLAIDKSLAPGAWVIDSPAEAAHA